MAYLWPGLRRDTIGCDLKIYIEQDRTTWFLEVEPGRHPIDKQFGQGHCSDVWGLDRRIGLDPDPDILLALTRCQPSPEVCATNPTSIPLPSASV